MKKKQTPSTIIEQIRVNSNVAYEANELSERLEKFIYNLPKYVDSETEVMFKKVADELSEICEIEHRSNARLLNEFKQLNK